MYSVYIVDDEVWVIESLKKGINWPRYGFNVIGSSHDSLVAVLEIKNLKPDLVLVDIRMPQLSGFDIIQEIRRENLAVEFVVVSGYAEFAYAQKALRFGVMGFCVKPIEEAEVAAVLERVKKTIDRRSVAGNSLGEEIIDIAESGSAQTFEARLVNAGFDFSQNLPYRALALRGPEDIFPFEGIRSYSCPVGINHRIWFLGDKDYGGLQDVLTRELCSANKLLGVSRRFSTSDKIRDAVQDAIIACHQYFIHAQSGVYEYPETPNSILLRDAIHRIEEEIDRNSADRIGAAFENLAEVLSSGFTAKHACFAYNAIHYILASHGVDDREPVYHFEELLGTYSDVGFMLASIQQTIDDILRTDEVIMGNAAAESTAQKAVRYVDDHYLEQISLRFLAEKFYINPSHLSRSFKQLAGESLTSYVAAKRISFACELLSSTDYPVAQIAERSGYDNYFYFARVFKRVKTETPTEYREKRKE